MNSKLLLNGVVWFGALSAIAMVLYPPDTIATNDEGIHTVYQFLFGGGILDIQWGRLILELSVPLLLIMAALITMRTMRASSD